MQAPIPTILVALDLGPSSEQLLRTASVIADATRTHVHVVHALDIQLLQGTEGDGGVFQEKLDEARERVRECVGRLIPPHVQIGEPHVVEHVAHRAILEHAKAVGAELILLAPRQLDASRDGFLGGTADHVLRAAGTECLLVNEMLQLPLRRIVVPVNFSPATEHTLEVALDWARRFGVTAARLAGRTEILVVHVMPALEGAAPLPGRYRGRARRLAAESTAFLESRSAGSGVLVRANLVEGTSPATEVVRYAAREEAELIVMSTHRATGDGGSNVIGTVAMGIVRSASCPILVVPPPHGPAAGAASAVPGDGITAGPRGHGRNGDEDA